MYYLSTDIILIENQWLVITNSNKGNNGKNWNSRFAPLA